jgi:hypothetical protein
MRLVGEVMAVLNRAGAAEEKVLEARAILGEEMRLLGTGAG